MKVLHFFTASCQWPFWDVLLVYMPLSISDADHIPAGKISCKSIEMKFTPHGKSSIDALLSDYSLSSR